MRYILLSFLIWLSGIFVVWNILKEDNSLNKYFEGNTFQKSKSKVFSTENVLLNKRSDNISPKVKLLLPQDEEFYTWDTLIRYSIDVSDIEDGESKYGEINPNEVILEIEYIPIADEQGINKKISEREVEHAGLTLMKKSTCFNCHADKTVHTGPSFLEIADRYEKNSSNIKSLANHILGGSVEIWGDRKMPAHPQFTTKETEQIADYILTQGKRKYNWVLSGLEGTFRIIEKPVEFLNGSCILTASYISKSKMKGQQTVVLQLR